MVSRKRFENGCDVFEGTIPPLACTDWPKLSNTTDYLI